MASLHGRQLVSRICLIALRFQLFIAFTERKNKVPFSVAIGHGELMHECFPKHLRMGTARMKSDKKTDEGGKKKGVNIEKRKAGTKRDVPTASHILIKIR